MRCRSGQIAIYLVLVLVALSLLTLSNVGVFLAVRAKNRLMNAGDAAALAVAKYQGELLNEIGADNLAHLRAALIGDTETCERIYQRQARVCFLGPLEGIAIGNRYARENGAAPNDEMLETLERHVDEIRRDYRDNPEIYPEPWEGAWDEYASALEAAIGGGLVAGPDNIDFLDANGGHLLLRKQFYNAVEGENWCWFHFYARSAVDDFEGTLAASPLPIGNDATRARKCINSEVYSLGLEAVAGSAVDLLGEELICRLTGCTTDDIKDAPLLRDPNQIWFLYDDASYASGWRQWTELTDPEMMSSYVGSVRDEFNVRGCSAVCRVAGEIPDVGLSGADGTRLEWNAAAKPFGTVTDERGELVPVTALRRFVVPAFTSVRLVSVDSVGGMDLSTSDPDWALHTRWHVPAYLARGVEGLEACSFCAVLRKWDQESTRRRAHDWLRINAGNCHIEAGPGGRGGAFPPH